MAAVQPDTVTTEESSSFAPVESTAQKKNRDGSYDPSEDENDEDEDDEDEDESVDEKDVLPPTEKVVLPKNKRGRQIKKIVTPQGQFPNSLGSHAHQTIN